MWGITAKQHLWVLELHNGVDNRLTHELILKAIMPALDTVEREWRVVQRAAVKKPQEGRGALIIVGKKDQDKFFSNGAGKIRFVSMIGDSNDACRP